MCVYVFAHTLCTCKTLLWHPPEHQRPHISASVSAALPYSCHQMHPPDVIKKKKNLVHNHVIAVLFQGGNISLLLQVLILPACVPGWVKPGKTPQAQCHCLPAAGSAEMQQHQAYSVSGS